MKQTHIGKDSDRLKKSIRHGNGFANYHSNRKMVLGGMSYDNSAIVSLFFT
jgi:hypothetical protein